MQKNKITVIIALMSIALPGIILLQVYWIRHDFMIKEQQFNQQVSEAMNVVADKLETRQALHFVGRSFFRYEADTNFWKAFDSSILPPEPPKYPEPPSVSDPGIKQHSLNRDSVLQRVIVVRKGLDGTLNKSFPYGNIEFSDSTLRGDTWHKEQIKIMTDTCNSMTEINHLRIEQGMLKNEHTRIENTRMQADIEKQKVRTEQELIKMKVKITSKVEKLNEVMNLLAVEYAKNDQNVTKIISNEELGKLLSAELKNRGVNTPFNYGLLAGKKDSLIEGNQPYLKDTLLKAQLLKTNYRVSLFPNDLTSKGEYLLLHFPARTSFVLSSMIWMLTGSVLFTATIIIVFAYTLYMLMRQKKISDIKSDFINNMTHEFKTPIATIALAVDAINNPKVHDDKEKVQYYSNIIREENKRMNKQVETILHTALFEKQDFKINKKETDIHEVITKAVENIKIQVESRGGAIIANLDATYHILYGDEILLTTAIVNLLDNANKYSPEAPQITVNTENRGKGILISVADKGMGMSRDTINKIFDKFYRQQSGNVHDVKGFGLGLSNVKTIVSSHGGEIKVTSEPGKGSRFEIYLPLEEMKNEK